MPPRRASKSLPPPACAAKVSESIRVLSLVGRFLEHERVYLFGPPSREELFLSSADWMPRNLDRRVEILFAIADPTLRDRIHREVIEPLEHDDCRVFTMDGQGAFHHREPPDPAERTDAQVFAEQQVARLHARASDLDAPSSRALFEQAPSRDAT